MVVHLSVCDDTLQTPPDSEESNGSGRFVRRFWVGGLPPIQSQVINMASYALARTYRPQSFAEVIGQAPIVQALTNALSTGRLHHAYLFSGTRGVGKTSLARLLAKCLSCEQGPSATPCGICSACQAIVRGNYIDLLEVDAASRTKVEDTRELLDSVHYPPLMGRTKIILIDEVHMLSGHSFNALLKTLEEPPTHVVFLLATTEPEKLPSTILSRCLQFNLKPLSEQSLIQHFSRILEKENISFEPTAVALIAQSAQGSVRDGLSLLEPCIAFCGSKLTAVQVSELLGLADHTSVQSLLDALFAEDAIQVFALIRQLAEKGADFNEVLSAFIRALHQIAMDQVLKKESPSKEIAERIQLFYQIALLGQRDLPLAPNPQMGFEMIFIRLLAFQPWSSESTANPDLKKNSENLETVESSEASSINTVEPESIEWNTLYPKLNLSGLCALLASHCALLKQEENCWYFVLNQEHSALYDKNQEKVLAQALSAYFNIAISVSIEIGSAELHTPEKIRQQKAEEALATVRQSLEENPRFRQILEQFHGIIVPDSMVSLEHE